jgi:hypothetical protein
VPFKLVWTTVAGEQYRMLQDAAEASLKSRKSNKAAKATKAEGLFKQVHGCLEKLAGNPRHPGLQTHKFDSLIHPYDPNQSVFEAYAQNGTPSAYRVFWCYGPTKGAVTIIAIMPHP